jgi:predicted PurR-regulated permease PerM
MNPLSDFYFIGYCIYLPIMLILTWYVARTLFRNGKTFMLDIFHNKEDIANATNKLFKTGFYLLNLGFGLMILEISKRVENTRDMIEALSPKIGGFSIYLGIMLFFNLFFFFRGRKASRRIQQTTLPVIEAPGLPRV